MPSSMQAAGSDRGEEGRRVDGPGGRTAPRFAEFDALRATAIFLVITLHAALAYTRRDIPRLLWGVREPGPGEAIDLFCWWAMAVSVPLFFAIAGFFAAMAVAARGPARFWAGRVRRVVVPTLACAPVILPACFFAWAVGWLVTGRCDFREVRRLRFADPAIEGDLYGPAHLWFVEYLIPILWAYGLSRRYSTATPRRPLDLAVGWLARWWAPLALAIPSTALMLAHRLWTGVDAGIDRHNAIFPEPLRLLHFALFFLAGAAVHDVPGLLPGLARRGWWLLAASAPVFALRAWALPLDWRPDAPTGMSLLAAGAGALGSWLAVFGMIGAYRRVFHRPAAIPRYLAGASFWAYLVHLPIVGLMQADLVGVALPAGAKFAATWAVTVGLSLASYEVFVRRTALGRFLDGRWSPRARAVAAPSPAGPTRLGVGPLLSRRPRLDRIRSRR